jgi:UDP-N-acetylmuramate: L-alanyl-gamma-D-glutamyl-meso-diaminopimelate ligase
MGALAGLLSRAGHRVSGSDVAFHPPMGEALERWGIEKRAGWDPGNLDPAPDLVVVGNVCRRDNPEARAAIDGGLPYDSLPGVLEKQFLSHRPGYVVAGSHGKTTTTSLLAHLLQESGSEPGFLVGGIPRNFDEGFRLGADGAPFVIEGDEYDSAFFEKTPKFWRYHPYAAILTSIEHDHIDIFPDADSYRDAFVQFVRRIPEDGVLVAWAGSEEVRQVAKHARCRVRWYALDGDDVGDVMPVWTGAMVGVQDQAQPFDLFVGGSACGRAFSPLTGKHNVRNAIAAIALVAETTGRGASDPMGALAQFAGVRRRQELLGVAGGVRVYDDFAHHPTAVRETLRGLRAKHPEGRLLAAFEPKSATASRRLHQQAYPGAFASADLALLAPVGRPEIPEAERLDPGAIAQAIRDAGGEAEAPPTLDGVVDRLVHEAQSGDTVVLMSNGPFGGIHDRLLVELATRRAS